MRKSIGRPTLLWAYVAFWEIQVLDWARSEVNRYYPSFYRLCLQCSFTVEPMLSGLGTQIISVYSSLKDARLFFWRATQNNLAKQSRLFVHRTGPNSPASCYLTRRHLVLAYSLLNIASPFQVANMCQSLLVALVIATLQVYGPPAKANIFAAPCSATAIIILWGLAVVVLGMIDASNINYYHAPSFKSQFQRYRNKTDLRDCSYWKPSHSRQQPYQ